MNFLLFIILLFCSASAFADDVELAPIVISDSLKSTKTDTSTIQISTKNYQNRIVTVPEVLAEQSGLHLTRYGGSEESTSLSVRGSGSNEVGVYLDGIPLQTANGLGVNLTPLDLNSIKSIAVYKNGAVSEDGFVPQTGVVWIESKNIPGDTHYGASVEYGSFNTIKANTLFSKKWKKFGLLLSNSFHHTDGDFSFLDNNGTPVNTADDATIRRINNEANTYQPLLKLSYDFDDKTEVVLLNRFVYQDRGIPGITSNQSVHAGLTEKDYLFGLKVNRKDFFLKNLNFSNLIYQRFYQSQFDDSLAEIGLGRAQDNNDTSSVFGNKMVFDYVGFKTHAPQLFVLYQGENFAPTNYLASPQKGKESSRYQFNVGLSDVWSLGKVVLKPHVSLMNTFNRLNNDDTSLPAPGGYENAKSRHDVAGSLGVSYGVLSWMTLEGNVARVLRQPTFSELFGDRGGFVGNPSLKAQKSLEWDAGVVLKRHKFFARTAYYERRVDDLIQLQIGSGVVRAENVGEALLRGVEVQAGATLFKSLTLGGNYTYQSAIDKAQYPGRTLVGRPKHEINVQADYKYKKINPYVSFNYLDANYLDPLNTRVVTHRSFVNAGVSYEATKNITLGFEAKNLSDEKTVDVVGFPLPGRSFFGKISFKK
ncbi:TonB-dependent receptor [bacterium]|nr:TonB-dependent receptor [bacterium]